MSLRIASVAAVMVSLTACAPNAKQTTATVTTIDRRCRIVETRFDENYKKTGSQIYSDSCNSIDEWEKVRAKRSKDVDGTAVIHLSYVAPQTGQSQTGELKFDGHDDEFYKLKAGDEIQILVSDAD